MVSKERLDKTRKCEMSHEATAEKERSTLERVIRQKWEHEEEMKAERAREAMIVNDSEAKKESEEVDDALEWSRPRNDLAEDSGAESTTESKVAEPGAVAAGSAMDIRE